MKINTQNTTLDNGSAVVVMVTATHRMTGRTRSGMVRVDFAGHATSDKHTVELQDVDGRDANVTLSHFPSRDSAIRAVQSGDVGGWTLSNS